VLALSLIFLDFLSFLACRLCLSRTISMLPIWRVRRAGSSGSALTLATDGSGDASLAEFERETEEDLKD
jgi:hypothetical protein